MILAGTITNSMLSTLHRAKAPTKEQEHPNPKGKPKAKKANTQGQRAQTPKGQAKAKKANTQEGKAQAQAKAVILWRTMVMMLKMQLKHTLALFLGSTHLYHQASN